MFRRYWDYTLPIRKFMADPSEEAVQVGSGTDSMLLQDSVHLCSCVAVSQIDRQETTYGSSGAEGIAACNAEVSACDGCCRGETGPRGRIGFRRRMLIHWRQLLRACATGPPTRPSTMWTTTCMTVRLLQSLLMCVLTRVHASASVWQIDTVCLTMPHNRPACSASHALG